MSGFEKLNEDFRGSGATDGRLEMDGMIVHCFPLFCFVWESQEFPDTSRVIQRLWNFLPVHTHACMLYLHIHH